MDTKKPRLTKKHQINSSTLMALKMADDALREMFDPDTYFWLKHADIHAESLANFHAESLPSHPVNKTTVLIKTFVCGDLEKFGGPFKCQIKCEIHMLFQDWWPEEVVIQTNNNNHYFVYPKYPFAKSNHNIKPRSFGEGPPTELELGKVQMDVIPYND